jgi:glycerophosphoryl diester phosphodiesterase
MFRTAVAAFAAVSVALIATPAEAATASFDVIGHRGAESTATVTENGRAAIKAAMQAGANGVEVDIRKTKDGQIVVMHDKTLNRTTGCSGEVEKMTYASVRACKLNSGEKVPNLYEVAWEFSKHDSKSDRLWVHVKLSPTSKMRKEIFKALDKYGLRAQTVILADEDDMLDAFAKWSKIERALIFNQADVNQGASESWGAGFDYAVPYQVEVTKARVAEAHAAGSKVYGVESNPVSLADAKALGLDGIVANDVLAAVAK